MESVVIISRDDRELGLGGPVPDRKLATNNETAVRTTIRDHYDNNSWKLLWTKTGFERR